MRYFVGNLLELPVTATQDYTLFHTPGLQHELWKRQIELIMEKHGLLSFIVHPDYATIARGRSMRNSSAICPSCVESEAVGSAVKDFRCPPKTVIGELDQTSGQTLATLYENIEAPLIGTALETAEMVKYVDKSWHALKIGYANEIGNPLQVSGL